MPVGSGQDPIVPLVHLVEVSIQLADGHGLQHSLNIYSTVYDIQYKQAEPHAFLSLGYTVDMRV